MASKTGIINVALRRIGAESIISITEGSRNANVMLDLYDPALELLLRSHTYNFATDRAKLSRLAAAPTFEYTYAYQLPSDYRRVLSASDNDDGVGHVPYRLEANKRLLADSENVYLRYSKYVTDPNAMDALFRRALSLSLARDACIALTSSRTLLADLREEALLAEMRARSADSMEDYPDDMPNGSWLEDRGL